MVVDRWNQDRVDFHNESFVCGDSYSCQLFFHQNPCPLETPEGPASVGDGGVDVSSKGWVYCIDSHGNRLNSQFAQQTDFFLEQETVAARTQFEIGKCLFDEAKCLKGFRVDQGFSRSCYADNLDVSKPFNNFNNTLEGLRGSEYSTRYAGSAFMDAIVLPHTIVALNITNWSYRKVNSPSFEVRPLAIAWVN